MKKEKKTELTREKILKAAIEEFGANGYAKGSINNICSTGISKGLIYHNFKSKNDLYFECVKYCFTDMKEYILIQDIKSNVQNYMEARMTFFRDNPYLAKLFFETILSPPIQLNEEIKELRNEFESMNKQLFKDQISQMTLRDGITEDDAMEYFTFIQNMFNGYFSSYVSNSMTFSDAIIFYEERLSKFLDFIFYGVVDRRNA